MGGCAMVIANIIIKIQHLFLRHISSHYGHSEAHFSLKHLHIINNMGLMIKNCTIRYKINKL